jgi:hypothetical protein
MGIRSNTKNLVSTVLSMKSEFPYVLRHIYNYIQSALLRSMVDFFTGGAVFFGTSCSCRDTVVSDVVEEVKNESRSSKVCAALGAGCFIVVGTITVEETPRNSTWIQNELLKHTLR